MNAWPIPTPPPPPPPPSLGPLTSSNYPSKPKVGLGVICRCQPTCVQCLLVRRGRNFVSPLKWSFPGGRLDEEGDLEDDGEKGTERELMKECGGGEPNGLPPLIHIECYKSGKTFYHVYVVDWEGHPEWCQWLPAATMQHTGEVDTAATQLYLQGQSFSAEKGFCWVDLQTLVEECMIIGSDQGRISSSELQHGLIRWIFINGENILKTLIARSPKLAHHRRYIASTMNSTSTAPSSSSSSSPSSSLSSFTSSAAVTAGAHMNTGKPPLGGRVPVPGDAAMLNPMLAGQLFRPPLPYVNMPPIPPTLLLQQAQGGVGAQIPLLSFLQQQQQQQQATGVLSNGTPFHNQALNQQPSPGSPGANSKGGLEVAAVHSTHLDSPVEGHPVGVDTNQGFHAQGSHLPPSLNAAVTANPQAGMTTAGPLPGVSQLEQGGVVLPVVEDSGRRHQSRKDTLCKYYMQGHCPYGDGCWFLHPMDPKPRHREPLLGPGGILTSAMQPMNPHPGAWQPNLLSPDEYAQLVSAAFSPPQSPLSGPAQSPISPTAWQMAMGSRPLFLPLMRGGLPMPAVPGQPPPPHPLYRPGMVYPGQVPRFFPHQQSMLPNFQDPVLKFKLLSEVVVRDPTDTVVSDLSHLTVRADHFYLSFGNTVRDYKVLFGGDRRYSDSHILTAEQPFLKKVTCLHSSKLTPSLVVVGMEDGSVFTWDLKRGGMNSVLLPVHETEPATSEGAITSLIHFTTTMSGAQVVVAGNKLGVVTWYISQPPMKTFTVLSSESQHSPSSVCSLQILGGYLISGGSNGVVCLWSMRSHEPQLTEKFQAHANSLMDIYVLDTNTFLTVGVNNIGNGDSSVVDQVNTHVNLSVHLPSSTNATVNAADGDTVENLTSELSQFSLDSNHALSSTSSSSFPSATTQATLCTASLWLFGQPVQNIKNIDGLGPIMCTAYHQQPMFGNRFLAAGQRNGMVKVYNVPNFSVASEIHFPEMQGQDCRFVALNLSRDKENTHFVNIKNPFRDLILTTSWSDGHVMVCQIDARRGSP